MDLHAIRTDLAGGAQGIGYASWDYEPDDPQNLPACIVGGLKSAVRLNRIVTQIELPVTFYVSTAEAEDAARKLDSTMSIGLQDGQSYLDWLDSVQNDVDMSWRSVRFLSSGAYQRVQLPGNPGPIALSVQLDLELTA